VRQACWVTLRRPSRFLRSHATATAFLVLLVTAEITYSALSGHDQQAVRDWSSTNVGNLRAHPIGALVASAFIASESPLAWPLLVGLGMVGADSLLGWRRSLALLVSAHVLGTLVSEGTVAWQVAHGALAREALNQDDVGPSYIVVCALTLALLYGWVGDAPTWVRIVRPAAGLVGLLALREDLVAGLSHVEVAAVGHAVSMLTAAVLGGALLAGRRARKARGRPGRDRPGLPAESNG
jgi:hypothetical protein